MNESQTGSASEQAAAYEFPSLAVLKAAHLKLLEQESAAASPEKASSAFLADVRDFMLRASATGRILDDEKERGIAQTLINYWVTVLFRAGMRDEMIPRTSLVELDESAGRDLDDSQCPYRGLDAYSESTAHLFFGRKQVIANWLGVLRQKLLLVVLGPSGSGKTSLIRAGLLPTLRAGGLPGSETWKVNETTLPGEDPASALREALEAEANNPRALLVVHRLDEIFLHCDRKTQHRLMAAIAKWVAAPGTERRAVTAARLESAGLLTQWLRQGELAEISKAAFIPPFGARELRAVIEEPAAQIGLHFEEGIIDTLINEFLGDPAALALLQFTLIKLWDVRERNHITWAAYRAIGGGQGAVETTAEAVYGAPDFDEVDRDLTRKTFLRLVRPSLTRELVANSVPETSLADGQEARERVRRIVERFEKAQLVCVWRDVRGKQLIEVTHEALLRKWPRLLQWLDDVRLELLQRQRIGVAAAQWGEQGRDPSTLWTGVLLTAALSIRDQLSPSEREFVDESRRATDRRRKHHLALLTTAIVVLIVLLLREILRGIDEHRTAQDTKAALDIERGDLRVARGDPAGAFLFFQQAATDDPNASSNRLTKAALNIARGERRVENADPAGAFLFFQQAAVDDPNASSDWLHRCRLGATWRQLPRLKYLLYLAELTRSELSPSGEYVVGTSNDAARLWRLSEGWARTGNDPLKDHPHGRVMWASFHTDPAQPLIAIAMADPHSDGKSAERGEVVIFDARSNQPVGEPIRFADGVPQKAWFSPAEGGRDQLLVVSQPPGGRGGEVSIWNFRTATREAVLRDHTLPVNWAAFSRDGDLVVTAAGALDGGEIGEARIWDWKNDRSAPLQHDGGPIAYAEFAYAEFEDNCEHVLTAEGAKDSSRGAARVWSVLRRKTDPFLQIAAVTAPLSHSGAVNRAHFSPNGLWVATASSDRTARLWYVRTQKEVLSFEHDGDVNDAVFSPDGRYLATASRDRTARIWELATGQLVQAPLNHSETVTEIAYSRDGRSLVSSSKHLARAWAANRDEPKARILKASDSILTVVSSDGQRVLTVSNPKDEQSDLQLWQTATGELIASQKLDGPEPIRCAVLNADGSRLAVANRDSSGKQPMLQIFQLGPAESGPNLSSRFKKTAEFQTGILLGSDVVSAAFDVDGGRLGVVLRKTGERESQVAICDVAGETVQILRGQEPSLVSRVQLSPSGKYLLACFTRAGENTGHARLWSVDGGSSAPSDLRHDTEITTGSFSPDERWLLTGSTDDDARLWPIADGRVTSSEVLREASSEHTHTADVTRVLFSPDGRQALTASKDQTAILWDLTSGRKGGRRIAVLHHSAYVNDAVFSARGNLILTSSGEPQLRAWSAVTGELLARFTPSGEVLQTDFAPDGSSIFAIGQKFAKRPVQADPAPDGRPAAEPLLREVWPMTWSFAPLSGDLALVKKLDTLIAARQIDGNALEKAVTEELPQIWNSEEPAYHHELYGPEPGTEQFHLAVAEECEATKQWFAAAWHLTKLLEMAQNDALRADMLLRRAQAYAQEDNWADSLPKCIADHNAAIKLGRNSAKDYYALAEAYLGYGNASGKAEQWDLAIEALREATRRNPDDSRNFILLGEAFAGKRDFAQADEEFRQALALGSTGAFARRALVGWLQGDEQGKKQYRDICMTLNDPSTTGWKAISLLWPSVLTNAFEKDELFYEELVRRAKESRDAQPTNFYRVNTYGAALYRATRYEEAIKALEAARDADLADRVNTLSQYYDHLIRVPISRTPEGRAQDWAFLAMANARLGRRSAAWDWFRKLRDAPELSHLARLRNVPASYSTLALELRNVPVSYSTLALELLYVEALEVLLLQPAPNSAGQ